ncbi:MAG TPA: hypothetical protein VMX17_15740 [Candidatus Glassbacteria bacterium]|nr:hypothetical protein [Candidatus Glassbacteria bacterium]
MKLSAERKTKLYSAIHDSIMKTRIEMKLLANDDVKIAQLVNKIYDNVCNVLNIKGR